MTNTTLIPTLSQASVINCLSNVSAATAYRFDVKDSQGNPFHCSSVIELTGQSHRYAAVYHSPTAAQYYSVNLAVSDDLINWTFVRTLLPNASMPKIVRVAGSDWVMIVHEQWMNTVAGASTAPCRIGYALFYDFNDLLGGVIRSTYLAPSFSTAQLDGTPSVYNASLEQSGGYFGVSGQFGFHAFDGTRDLNCVTTSLNLFNPVVSASTSPSIAQAYNALFTGLGAVSSIGQRDTLQTTTARYNVQEANINAASDFSAWRMWLYTFGDSFSYPTGVGSAVQLQVSTPGGSTSIGNPSVNVVNSPGGTGLSLVVSYFLFSEGAAPGEAGPLIYYYDI